MSITTNDFVLKELGERMWRTVFYESSQASLITSPDLRIRYANPAAATLLGLPVEGLTGLNFYSQLTSISLDPDSLNKRFQRLKDSPSFESFPLEIRTRSTKGMECWLQAKCQRIAGEDEICLYWVLTDITDLKSSDSLLNFFAQTLISFDKSLGLKSMVARGAQIGIEHLGDWCRIDLLESTKLKLVAAAHKDSSLDDTIWSLDKTYPAQEEDIFSAQKVIRSGAPEFHPNTEELIGAYENQGRLKALQSLGLKSYICLPIRVGEIVSGTLTLGAAENQFSSTVYIMAEELAAKIGLSLERATYYQGLEELKNAAEAASISKTHFLANVSHEIRTPLGAVLGFADLILCPEQSAENRRIWGEKIRLNGKRLLRIIDDILDLSKVEVGKLEIENRKIDFKELLIDIYGILKIKAENKNIDLNFILESPVPSYIFSDDTRLAQILCNIIGNALKFTSIGQVNVKIKLDKTDGHHQLIFTIEDTGLGLTADQASRLFQPFSQGDTSHTRRFGGTGLGLALSRRLAQLMKGEVSLTQSKPGVGSTFVVRIDPGPIDGAAIFETLDFQEEQGVKLANPTSNIEGVNILLVEDSHDNRLLFSTFLEAAGAKITLAVNGEEGVVKALEGSFDIILMDIQMPVKDGYEAVQDLRSRGYSGPIIALTAHAMKAEQEKCIRIGCNSHLTKPVAREKLISAIAENVKIGL